MIKCTRCLREVKDLRKNKSKMITNHSFGRESKSITTIFCKCGGILK